MVESWDTGDTLRDGVTVNLLHHPGLKRWEEFTCLNSLREVEPTVTLLLDERPMADGSQHPFLPPARSVMAEGCSGRH